MKILVIDYDLDWVVDFMFCANGNLVLEKTNNPIDALKQLQASAFDLVIMESDFSDISGKNLILQIRKINNRQNIVVYSNHKREKDSLLWEVDAWVYKKDKIDALRQLFNSQEFKEKISKK